LQVTIKRLKERGNETRIYIKVSFTIVRELSKKFNNLLTNVGKGTSLFENVQPKSLRTRLPQSRSRCLLSSSVLVSPGQRRGSHRINTTYASPFTAREVSKRIPQSRLPIRILTSTNETWSLVGCGAVSMACRNVTTLGAIHLFRQITTDWNPETHKTASEVQQ
jgi:hypothetical protein